MDLHLLDVLDNFDKIINLPNRPMGILLMLTGECSPE